MTAAVEIICYFIMAFFLDIKNVHSSYNCDKVFVSNGDSSYVLGKKGRVTGPFSNVDTVTVKCMKGSSSFDVPVTILEIIQQDDLLGFMFLMIIGTIMLLFIIKKRNEIFKYVRNKLRRTPEEGDNEQQAIEGENNQQALEYQQQQPHFNAAQAPAVVPAIPALDAENPPPNGPICGVWYMNETTNEQI